MVRRNTIYLSQSVGWLLFLVKAKAERKLKKSHSDQRQNGRRRLSQMQKCKRGHRGSRSAEGKAAEAYREASDGNPLPDCQRVQRLLLWLPEELRAESEQPVKEKEQCSW